MKQTYRNIILYSNLKKTILVQRQSSFIETASNVSDIELFVYCQYKFGYSASLY